MCTDLHAWELVLWIPQGGIVMMNGSDPSLVPEVKGGDGVLRFLSSLYLVLAFQLAYLYIQCTDASWPASSYDADVGNQDQHPAPRRSSLSIQSLLVSLLAFRRTPLFSF
ncbi:hypothetical protein MTR67_031589 [Solanum verrucosum]|uniref:Uncharacterized protein n=1 Tax=Solanum verrucosum TaxID=315347 RepID=A0AAF0U2S8_SOLVR|nr:hypothetical protein MTR67_031589 [Solanum verrucosum]